MEYWVDMNISSVKSKKGVAQVWKCQFPPELSLHMSSPHPQQIWPTGSAQSEEAGKTCYYAMQNNRKWHLVQFQFSVFGFSFLFFLLLLSFARAVFCFLPFFAMFFFIFFLLLFSLLIANCSFASDKQQSTQDWGLHYKRTWGMGMVRLLRTGLGLGLGLGLWSCSCIQIFLIKCLMAMRRGFNCTWLRAYRQME